MVLIEPKASDFFIMLSNKSLQKMAKNSKKTAKTIKKYNFEQN